MKTFNEFMNENIKLTEGKETSTTTVTVNGIETFDPLTHITDDIIVFHNREPKDVVDKLVSLAKKHHIEIKKIAGVDDDKGGYHADVDNKHKVSAGSGKGPDLIILWFANHQYYGTAKWKNGTERGIDQRKLNNILQ